MTVNKKFKKLFTSDRKYDINLKLLLLVLAVSTL